MPGMREVIDYDRLWLTPEIDDETIQKAAIIVAGHSHDLDDLVELLKKLGIHARNGSLVQVD